MQGFILKHDRENWEPFFGQNHAHGKIMITTGGSRLAEWIALDTLAGVMASRRRMRDTHALFASGASTRLIQILLSWNAAPP